MTNHWPFVFKALAIQAEMQNIALFLLFFLLSVKCFWCYESAKSTFLFPLKILWGPRERQKARMLIDEMPGDLFCECGGCEERGWTNVILLWHLVQIAIYYTAIYSKIWISYLEINICHVQHIWAQNYLSIMLKNIYVCIYMYGSVLSLSSGMVQCSYSTHRWHLHWYLYLSLFGLKFDGKKKLNRNDFL